MGWLKDLLEKYHPAGNAEYEAYLKRARDLGIRKAGAQAEYSAKKVGKWSGAAGAGALAGFAVAGPVGAAVGAGIHAAGRGAARALKSREGAIEHEFDKLYRVHLPHAISHNDTPRIARLEKERDLLLDRLVGKEGTSREVDRERKRHIDEWEEQREKHEDDWEETNREARKKYLEEGFLASRDFLSKKRAEHAMHHKMDQYQNEIAKYQEGYEDAGFWGKLSRNMGIGWTGLKSGLYKGAYHKVRYTGISWSRVFFILLIIMILFFLAWGYISQTAFGSQIGAGVTLVSADVREQVKKLTGPLNIIGDIITGKYDVTALWTSQQIEEEYDRVAKDIGVKAVALRAQRPVYFPVPNPEENTIKIDGRLEVKNPPGGKTEVFVDAEEGSDFCLPGQAGGRDREYALFCEADWECEIIGTGKPSVEVGEYRRDLRFVCERDGIDEGTLDKGFARVLTPKVTVKYNSVAYAGRQIFVVDSLEAENVFAREDSVEPSVLAQPILGISPRDDVIQTSWQKGDESVQFAIGVFGQDEGILIASPQEADFEQPIGVRFLNPTFAGSNVVTEVKKVNVTFPVVEGLGVLDDTEWNKEVSENIVSLVANRTSMRRAGYRPTDLKAGDDLVLVADVEATDDFLSGAPFSSFFVFAEVNFEMQTEQMVDIKILGVDPIED